MSQHVSDPAKSPPPQPSPKAFAALRHPGFRAYFLGNAMVMMADSIEHVISYWVIFQKFHMPALAGFAVISHWAPFLLFSVYAGALADRFDPRRIIQIGIGLFIIASLAWAFLLYFDILEVWHAGVILLIHGMAGVFWVPPGQILIHDIVGPAHLQSGVRLLATSRMLGLLFGPVVGSAVMFAFGPALGLVLNVVFYLPLMLWLIGAPYGPKFREAGQAAQRAAMRGLFDIFLTLRAILGMRVIVSMMALAGASSFLVGQSFQAQMPEFASDLGTENAGFQYGVLLWATATGALIAGLGLESRALLPPRPRTALILAMLWAIVICGFAISTSFYLSTVLLFAAGFLQLSYFAMTQTLVQLHAPAEMRGRVIGLYNSCALGLQTFSGITVGIVGNYIGIHWSLGLSAAVLMAVILGLVPYTMKAQRATA